MMHLRVICPADTTQAVLDLLHAEPGAANVVIHPGAAIDPIGDVIICDIARTLAIQRVLGHSARVAHPPRNNAMRSAK